MNHVGSSLDLISLDKQALLVMVSSEPDRW